MDDEEWNQRGAQPERREARGEVHRQRGAVGAVAQCVAELGPPAGSLARYLVTSGLGDRLGRRDRCLARRHARGGEEDDGDHGGDRQCAGVEEEGRANRERQQDPTDGRAGHSTDEEAALPGRRSAAALVGVNDAQQQGHR